MEGLVSSNFDNDVHKLLTNGTTRKKIILVHRLIEFYCAHKI